MESQISPSVCKCPIAAIPLFSRHTRFHQFNRFFRCFRQLQQFGVLGDLPLERLEIRSLRDVPVHATTPQERQLVGVLRALDHTVVDVGTADGALERGWLYRDGVVSSLRGMAVTTTLAADGLRQQGVTLIARDKAGATHRFDGEVLRSVPLVARGHENMAVFEGLTRWRHGEAVGYGICEYAHQLDEDGRPLTPIE